MGWGSGRAIFPHASRSRPKSSSEPRPSSKSCPQEYGNEASSLPGLVRATTGGKSLVEQFRMATFNRIFTTERLLQIILVLAATLIMKLYS